MNVIWYQTFVIIDVVVIMIVVRILKIIGVNKEIVINKHNIWYHVFLSISFKILTLKLVWKFMKHLNNIVYITILNNLKSEIINNIS